MERQFASYLKQIRETLLIIVDDKEMSLHHLAGIADLSPQTVYRLMGNVTRDPKLRTIWKLGRVMGLEPQLKAVKTRLKSVG